MVGELRWAGCATWPGQVAQDRAQVSGLQRAAAPCVGIGCRGLVPDNHIQNAGEGLVEACAPCVEQCAPFLTWVLHRISEILGSRWGLQKGHHHQDVDILCRTVR